MNIAKVVAQRSTCTRRQVGAIIVKDKQILSTGYNGSPRGTSHCNDIGCIREKQNIPSGTRHEVCRAIHAEQNAIIQAALHGTSIRDSTLYCTHQPCILCAKMLINASIKRIVFANGYPDTDAIEMLNEAGVEICKISD